MHTSCSGEQTSVAVLMLPPFGWENDCSYRSQRDWATALAQAGVMVARLDLPGTENSVGGPLDANRAQSWTDAAGATAQWLRERSGCTRLVAIGIGLGGLIAYQVAAQGGAIDDLVLWGVRATGRSYLRELRAYAAVVAGQVGDAENAETSDGAIAIGGHVLSHETADAVSAIKLTSLQLPQAERRRVLLVGRDAHGVDEKLRAHIEASGAALTVMDATDYHCLMAPPEASLTPTQTIQASIGWVKQGAEAVERPSASPTPPASLRMLDRVEFEHRGATVRERISELETPLGRLVGIISEPTTGEVAPYCLVVVNAGALRHTGPHRMFVEITRLAAASGVPAARFDLPGIGDSDGPAVKLFERTVDHDTAELATLAAIYDHLEQLGVAHRFVGGGLCLGAYLPLRAVLEDNRMVGAISVNTPTLRWSERQRKQLIRWIAATIGTEAVETGRVVRPGPRDSLTRLRYKVDLRARQRLAENEFLWRIDHRSGIAEASRTVDQLGRSGARVHLLFSENELVLRMLDQRRLTAKLQRFPNINLHRLPNRDHTLRPLWIQEMVFDHFARALQELKDPERTNSHG
ncbi:MAG TPA: alpha/beta fold hydrolase [Solirubrobacteraceae bacterium]|nr:alpha/beta fold hydrolase [Solirubrobacteraceae bacterium]